MGCDIHTYREAFRGGQWVSVDEWVAYDYGEDEKGEEIPHKKQAYDGRNYDLFGVLAGVRQRECTLMLTPRGIPFDVSEKVRCAHEKWDADGHSHSYLYLHELRALKSYIADKTMPVGGLKEAEGWAKFKASIDSGSPDWNLLYPYCQGSSDRTYVEFKLDIPMSFMIGEAVDKMINSFDDIEGDNHRLVFWFDN